MAKQVSKVAFSVLQDDTKIAEEKLITIVYDDSTRQEMNFTTICNQLKSLHQQKKINDESIAHLESIKSAAESTLKLKAPVEKGAE